MFLSDSFALEHGRALSQKSASAFANVLSGEERAKKLPLERQTFFEIQLAAANNSFQTGSNSQRRELRNLVRQEFSLLLQLGRLNNVIDQAVTFGLFSGN